MLLILSAILNFAAVIPLIAFLRIKELPKYVISVFLFFIAEIILVGNILGVLHQLNNQGLWLVIQAIILVIVWIFWVLFKRPALFIVKFVKPNWKNLSLLQKTLLILLGFFILAGYSILIYLIFVVPPNNNDSMVVHLVRVGYWLQHGSFTPWQSFIERQVIYPYDAQIVVLWSILFKGTDLFAPFLQYFCVLFTALGIYCISREIGAKRFQSLLVALFYLTFPQVILQATTTQDDLAVTCFLTLGTLFFVRWFDKARSTKSDLLLTAISFAIALGIKPTAYYFFIGFALFVLIMLLIKRIRVKQILQLIVVSLVAFLVLSSFSYINNIRYFGNPLGPADFVKSESGFFTGSILEKTKVNSARFLYQFISLDGLPTASTQGVSNFKASLAGKLPNLFDTTTSFVKDPLKSFSLNMVSGINEDYSWFGPVSFLLLIPAFFAGIVKAIKSKELKFVFLLIVPIFLVVGVIVLRPGWDPYQGRYVNPAIALSMPLTTLLIKRRPFVEAIFLLVSLLAILVLTCSVLVNDSKPLLTQLTINRLYAKPCDTPSDQNAFKKLDCYFYEKYLLTRLMPILPDRVDLYDMNRSERETISSPQQYQTLYELPQQVKANSTIGLVLLNGDWEYPFFGSQFEYKLVPVLDLAHLTDPIWLEKNGIDYLIIHQDENHPASVDSQFILQKEYKEGIQNIGWQIYRKAGDK